MESAEIAIKEAEEAWSTQDPDKILPLYTKNVILNYSGVITKGISSMLRHSLNKQKSRFDYKVKKELFIFTDNKMTLRFTTEYKDKNGQWFREYGIQQLEYSKNGLISSLSSLNNEIKINEKDRILK